MRITEYSAIQDAYDGTGSDGKVATPDLEAPSYGTDDDRRFFARAYGCVVGCYAIMMAAFSIVFLHAPDALFNVGVCVAYGVIYFGTPVFLGNMALRRDRRFRPVEKERNGLVHIGTGPVKPAAAFVQIILIPAALAVCTIGLVTIFVITTAGHRP